MNEKRMTMSREAYIKFLVARSDKSREDIEEEFDWIDDAEWPITVEETVDYP